MDLVKETDELELLKERADKMGVGYHPSIGVEKLKEKINSSLVSSIDETFPQKRSRLLRDANKLVRVQLSCMNPAKSSWPGEIFTVSNSIIGTIKKYIPFNAEDGWYIPTIILDVLKEKQYSQTYTVTVKGQKIKKFRLVKEFSIDVLPDLTVKELKALAAKQAVDKSVD